MKKVKADLHMHLDDSATVEDLKKLLKMSEKENLESISILGFNSVSLYLENGAFDLLARETNNNFSEYFSGKIIPSVEMVTTIAGMTSHIGEKYNGHRADLTLYDFDLAKISKYLNEDTLKQFWVEDFKLFSETCLNIGIKIPSIENFTNDAHPLSFVTQWFDMCKQTPNKIEQLESIFQIKLNSASDLTRAHISNPNGKLYFKQKLFPEIGEILKIAKQVGAKVCIAHPAHMSKDFDTADYMDTLVRFSKSNPDFQIIEYAFGDYMLNTQKDNEIVEETAKKLNLKLVCGSDLRLVDKMYYVSHLTNGEKVYYTPTPGFAIAKKVELGDGTLLMNKDYLEDFGDVKSFYAKYSK